MKQRQKRAQYKFTIQVKVIDTATNKVTGQYWIHKRKEPNTYRISLINDKLHTWEGFYKVKI